MVNNEQILVATQGTAKWCADLLRERARAAALANRDEPSDMLKGIRDACEGAEKAIHQEYDLPDTAAKRLSPEEYERWIAYDTVVGTPDECWSREGDQQ